MSKQRYQNGKSGKKSSKANSKPRKGKYQDNDSKDTAGRSMDNPTNFNDISWYVTNPDILRDVASYPFSNVVGPTFAVDYGSGSKPIDLPGCYVLEWAPTLGGHSPYSEQGVNAVNLAAKSIYSFLRSKNSGAKNYDPADIMMYLLAVDSALIWWSNLVRAYGVARTFSYTNRYMPDVILHALGFDGPDLRDNLAQFRFTINELAIKLNTLAVPGQINLFKRHMWMNDAIYADRESVKAQIYAYKPAGMYIYNETSGLGRLDWTPLASDSGPEVMTFANVKTISDALMEYLLRSQDIGIISGDILKAYGDSGIYACPMIPEDYTVVPVYKSDVLAQIHNSECVSGIEIGNITQEADGCIYQDITTTEVLNNPKTVLLDVPWDSPTPEDVMIVSRMTSAIDGDQVICGSEVIVDERIYYTIEGDFIRPHRYGPMSSDTILNQYIEGMLLTSNFQLPPLSVYSVDDLTTASSNLDRYMALGDTTNITPLSFHNLVRLHEAAMFGLFGLPYSLVGKFN